MLPVPDRCGADVVVTLEWIAESELALHAHKQTYPSEQHSTRLSYRRWNTRCFVSQLACCKQQWVTSCDGWYAMAKKAKNRLVWSVGKGCRRKYTYFEHTRFPLQHSAEATLGSAQWDPQCNQGYWKHDEDCAICSRFDCDTLHSSSSYST